MKNAPKFRHRLATQEDCDRINNGCVTLILWNKSSKKSKRVDK